MRRYEYKIVKMDEPSRPKGVLEGRSAEYVEVMSHHINTLAQTGWEYLRSDTLTTQRSTMVGRVEETLSVLVFRRPARSTRLDEGNPGENDANRSVVRIAFKRDGK